MFCCEHGHRTHGNRKPRIGLFSILSCYKEELSGEIYQTPKACYICEKLAPFKRRLVLVSVRKFILPSLAGINSQCCHLL
jgi:hypothetical protein